MKVLVIGSTGTLGRAAARALAARHEVVGASRNGDPKVDIENPASIEAALRAAVPFDAVVCLAGSAAWKPLAELGEPDFAASFRSKLMGQIAVIRAAFVALAEGGSVTVTSGVLAQTPMAGSAAVSLVNAGLEGFVRAAALEAPRRIRVNVVSPPWATDTLEQLGMDSAGGLAPDQIALAYVAAVEGDQRGQTIHPPRHG